MESDPPPPHIYLYAYILLKMIGWEGVFFACEEVDGGGWA
jgi:hypothetical protein